MSIPDIRKGQIIKVHIWCKPEYLEYNVTVVREPYKKDEIIMVDYKQNNLLKRAYWDGEKWCGQSEGKNK